MQTWQMAAGLLALGLSGAPGAALALTGPELWQDWQKTAQSWGATLTAKAERQEGGALVLEGLEAKLEHVPLGLQISWAQDGIYMTSLPDGAVEIKSESPAFIAGNIGGTSGLKFNFTLRDDGAVTRVWDEDPVRRYETKAAKLEGEGEITLPTALGPALSRLKLETVSINVSKEWRWRSGANPVIGFVARSESEKVQYSLLGANDVEVEVGTIETLGRENALSLTPPQTSGPFRLQSFAELAMLLDSGLSLTFSSSMREQRAEVHAGEDITNKGVAQDIRGEFSLNARGLSFASSANDVDESYILPGLPVPLAMKASGRRFSGTMPVMGGEPQEATLELHLRDFTLNESVWALFDPKSALPRDPMQLDLTLESTQAFDLLASAEMEMTTPTSPAPAPRFDRVAVPNLFFSGAGVEARGQGSFTFTQSEDGPKPDGGAVLNVRGLEAFVSTLEQGGTLPPDAITSLRAGIAMAFKKAPESDGLSLKLEAAPGGALLLNGMPLRGAN